jgi:hypothetical protein
MAATELLPLAMPPVRPSLSMIHAVEACSARDLARRRRAAFTVLLMSMVMVMGPTPPGTGVRNPAVWMASG